MVEFLIGYGGTTVKVGRVVWAGSVTVGRGWVPVG